VSDSQATNLTGLDDRLHAAYAAMGPSEDVRERVLASLQTQEVSQSIHRPRHPRWHIVVPIALAACLAVALVVILPMGMSSTARQAAQDTQGETVSFKNSTPVADVAPESIEEEQNSLAQDADSAEESMAAEVSSAADVPSSTWSLVELENGRRFEVGDPAQESVDGQKAQKATAYGADESSQTSCEVVDGRYVRFPNDDVWYVLVPQRS
jgi:hypothetical protein